GALVTLAIILAVGTIPAHALALRHATGRPGTGTSDPAVAPAPAIVGATRGEALRSAAFWWITAAFFLITLSTSALTVHLVPLLSERGYSQTFATSAAGVFALMAMPGRLIFTPLGDRFRRSRVIALIFLTHALGLLALLLTPGLLGVIGFIALFGAGFGAVTPARAALVADVYGAAHYGQISGVIAFATMLARALGPLGMSLLYDHAGGYPPGLVALTAAALLGMLALWLSERGGRASA
ncbi:MAG: MFS transporter, partial [Chloroflexota bacterium]|nr:MFS transporter [Chloroflexota bacterium]